MEPSLKNKKALVTGGTRGIGAAIAERLVADGAEVIVTGTKSGTAGPTGTTFVAADFVDPAAVEQLAVTVAQLEIDIVVNNAGFNRISPFAEILSSDFDQIQQVNLRAPFRLCQAALPGMRRKKWGRIVSIASIFSVVSKEYRASYSTSKFALDGLTAALAAEVAVDGVLANCVSPGFIETDLTRRMLGPEGIREMVSRVPIGRLGQPQEVAALVAWLVGPQNTFISGQNIVIDGGFTRV